MHTPAASHGGCGPTGIGAQRRLRALMARAWSPEAIEHAAGLPAADVRRALADRRRVSPELACAVARVYDQLWDTRPPCRTHAERAAADAHREHAEWCGWPPPMAYDDDTIDHPDGDPAPGWKRTGRTTIPAADLAEDARWVREYGGYRHATPAEVAVRLGVSRAVLGKALQRAARANREGREAG
ncbi:MAG TPA: hypothetical protein DEH11_16480 [Actinobacteria bacterium]|jgi:hypothetical protein|nr:hypothetical protein [Actinomycetota bacterium]